MPARVRKYSPMTAEAIKRLQRKKHDYYEEADDNLCETQTDHNSNCDLTATVSESKLLKKTSSKSSDGKYSDTDSSDSDSDSECDSVGSSDSDNEVDGHSVTEDEEWMEGIRLWDWSQLQMLLDITSVCAICKEGQVRLTEVTSRRQGWCSYIGLQCTNATCTRHTDYDVVSTSPVVEKKATVNTKSILAMRSIGRGRQATETFSGFMAIPPPLVRSTWKNQSTNIAEVTRAVAEVVMKECSDSIREGEDLKDIPVTVDGSWQSRGMQSNFGIVSAISAETGEVLDAHLMTNHCQKCRQMSHLEKDSEEYMEFYVNHFPECDVNHEGSSPSMETEGVSMLFSRSIEKHSIRYNPFIGDGDSKAFRRVCKDKPYGDEYIISKEECIGHVQKRMGTRLRNLVKKKQGIYIYITVLWYFSPVYIFEILYVIQ
jgi:hypothetical protein